MTLVGLEIEVPGLTRQSVRNMLRFLNDTIAIDIHDDGSLRDENFVFDDSGVNYGIAPISIGSHKIYPSGSLPGDRYGPEIVTVPFDHTLKHITKGLASVLQNIPDNSRASIHVHYDMRGKTWQNMQRVLRWFYHLEAPLYRLAALNKKHRGELYYYGENNNYRYCRPLSDSIGIQYEREKTIVHLIDIKKLLSASSMSEFFYSWGRMDVLFDGMQRYCPHRLHGINIVPIATIGTMEWRLWNGIYKYIPIIIDIVNAIHEKANMEKDPDFEPMLLGSEPDVSADYISSLIGVDISSIWGSWWAAGPIESKPFAHYTNVRPLPNSVMADYMSGPFIMGNIPNYQRGI